MASILKVKKILKNKGETISDLSNKMGINRVTLTNMLNGNPTLETLNKIAIALNIEVKDLFYSISQKNYNIEKNEVHNYFQYNDEHISMVGHLPHLTQNDYGTFKLDIKRKDFSIVPTSDIIKQMVYSEKTIEEQIFMGNWEDEILVQFFYTYTSLKWEEHVSFCSAIKLYKHYYKECLYEIKKKLGALNFKGIETNNDYFQLGEIEKEIWNSLMALTQKYDLDSKFNDFEKFNATNRAVIMYNKDEGGIKTWIQPKFDEYSNKVKLLWKSPTGYDRKKILSKQVFTAQESHDFIFNVMIPKSLEKK